MKINLGDIDTSLVADMSWLFFETNRTDFIGIESWDVSKVTTMRCMFEKVASFNQPL